MNEHDLLFHCVINGRPPVKKNTKKVYRRYGRTIVVYSAMFKDWEKLAAIVLKSKWKHEPLTCGMMAEFTFGLVNRHAEPDVSNLCEAPQDALEKFGVIKNDKLIHVVNAKKIFGVLEPFTEIKLFRLGV